MPTSSQALILYNSANDEDSIFGGASTSALCEFRRPASCAVASVYNIISGISPDGTHVTDRRSIDALSRDSAKLFKYHLLPQGNNSIPAFDKTSQHFQWHAPGGHDDMWKERVQSRVEESLSCLHTSGHMTNNQGNDVKRRPLTAIPRRECSTPTSVNPFLYEQLIGLGFRKSSLGVSDDCIKDSFSGRKTPQGTGYRLPEPPGRATAKSNKRDQSAKKISFASDPTEPKYSPKTNNKQSNDADEFYDDTDSDDEEITDGFYRIKPTMHMRKDEPEARPKAAIFSFRDNEYSSHAEVKYLIETQIGVKVKSIQFDPLDIRVVQPDVHSRWIVDFNTEADLEKSVKKGLVLGKDKLIFYKHDDIAKREVNSFKYYMTVMNARQKFKSKSAKSTRSDTSRSSARSTTSSKFVKSTNSTPITKF